MTVRDREGGWIQTFSGIQFYPLDAHVADVTIEDIAHALANTCRYGGHTLGYYSVAQHSVLVSEVCKPESALWGLLHDAPEAYLGDMVRPLKHGPGLEAFRLYEDRLMQVICRKFALAPWEPEDVKWADSAMLATEKRDLLRTMQLDMGEKEWLHGASAADALATKITPWAPTVAEAEFLGRFEALNRGRMRRGLGIGTVRRFVADL